jgi:hypothetical protein
MKKPVPKHLKIFLSGKNAVFAKQKHRSLTERSPFSLRNRMAKPNGLSPHTGCEAACIIGPNWWLGRQFYLLKTSSRATRFIFASVARVKKCSNLYSIENIFYI